MITATKGESKVWEIIRLYFDKNEKDLQVELHGYKNVQDLNAAKTGAKTVVEKLKFTFSGAEFPNVNSPNILTIAENLIRGKTFYGIKW